MDRVRWAGRCLVACGQESKVREQALDIVDTQLPMVKGEGGAWEKIVHVRDLISENIGSLPRQVVLR